GPLADIVDRFSRHKVIQLQFAESELPADLERYGRVFDVHPPRVKIEIPRREIRAVLTSLLNTYNIEDVAVQDRPLEEVIAEMFAETRSGHGDESAAEDSLTATAGS